MAILFAAFLVLLWIIRSTLVGAKDSTNITSVYLKILMNHLQILLLTASFNFYWPAQVEKLFSISSPITQVSASIFSIDCFLNAYAFNSSSSLDLGINESGESIFSIFYIKLVVIAASPFLVIIISYFAWIIIGKIKNQMFEVINSKAISSIIIVLFFIHPSVN